MKKTGKETEQNKTNIIADNLVSKFQDVINGLKSEITERSDVSQLLAVKKRVAFTIQIAEAIARICGMMSDEDCCNGVEDEEFSADASTWRGLFQDEVKWLLDDGVFKIYKGGFYIDSPPNC